VEHSHEGSIGNLCNKAIKEKFDVLNAAFPFEQIELALQNLIK
jgi:argininosuccinate lyase